MVEPNNSDNKINTTGQLKSGYCFNGSQNGIRSIIKVESPEMWIR